jgi:type VI secretion system protein ImpE
MLATELYQAGRLKEALVAATEEVKARPGEAGRRTLLCELLCFAGDLNRADLQLDALGGLDPAQAMGVSLLRHLVRGEQARGQFYAEGRLPEFLAKPSPELRLRLEASILIREGKEADATRVLDEAEAQRPRVSGILNGEPFDDLRDLDDLPSSVFEVLTGNGKYYWIPMDSVELVEFHPPERPQDLLWRPAHLVVRGGPDGVVYLPALYAGSHWSTDDRIRLGRATEWLGGDGSPVRGLGQRTFLAGERDLTILELEKLEFGAESGGPGAGGAA